MWSQSFPTAGLTASTRKLPARAPGAVPREWRRGDSDHDPLAHSAGNHDCSWHSHGHGVHSLGHAYRERVAALQFFAVIVRIGYRLIGLRIIATGQENVPANTACIFMANHVSNLDPPALLPRIPGRTSAFVKRSLMSVPVFGWALKLGEFIPVSRDGSASGAQESVAAARKILDRRAAHHHVC
jgi:1-acyl-sn-glycerol-3-phosphate acyltransferase